MALVHGSCVDVSGVGVLLRGPSGSGKSDLALRLIGGGARLVADDQVALSAADGELSASAPVAIAGLLEVRGLGPVPVAAAASTPLRLVYDLVEPEAVERLPGPATVTYEEIEVPLLRVAPFEASAPDKVRLAARRAKLGMLSAR